MQRAVTAITMATLWGLASPAAAAQWQLAGTTYNSVAFVDVASVVSRGQSKSFSAMRVSGQPDKDGWVSVVQQLSADCETGIFLDAGSVIEQSDGSLKKYPGFGASQRAA